jgi:hypothetical protein
VRIVQPRSLSGRLAVDQAVRPMGVELENPIPNDLKRHPADLRRFGARRAFVNRRQGEEPTRLRPVFRSLGGAPDHLRIKIGPKRIVGNRCGDPTSRLVRGSARLARRFVGARERRIPCIKPGTKATRISGSK